MPGDGEAVRVRLVDDRGCDRRRNVAVELEPGNPGGGPVVDEVAGGLRRGRARHHPIALGPRHIGRGDAHVRTRTEPACNRSGHVQLGHGSSAAGGEQGRHTAGEVEMRRGKMADGNAGVVEVIVQADNARHCRPAVERHHFEPFGDRHVAAVTHGPDAAILDQDGLVPPRRSARTVDQLQTGEGQTRTVNPHMARHRFRQAFGRLGGAGCTDREAGQAGGQCRRDGATEHEETPVVTILAIVLRS